MEKTWLPTLCKRISFQKSLPQDAVGRIGNNGAAPRRIMAGFRREPMGLPSAKNANTLNGSSSKRMTPVEIMEMQANKLPGYMLIGAESGKTQAETLLNSYVDNQSVGAMVRLVREMAQYYGTTQKAAKSRLITMGYTKAKGVLCIANGKIILNNRRASNFVSGNLYTPLDERILAILHIFLQSG